MLKQVLAIRLDRLRREEPDEAQLLAQDLENQEREVQNRKALQEPKRAHELLANLLPGFDIKRLVL